MGIEYNTDIDLLGKLKINTVPNNNGTVLMYGVNGIVSTRTNSELLVDMGLITANNIASLYYNKTQLQTSGQSQVHWGNLTNVPPTFTPTAHTHTISQVVGLTEELDLLRNTTYKTTINSSQEVTHMLNTYDITVEFYDISTMYTVGARVRRVTTDKIMVDFDTPPQNPIKVLIRKI